MKEFKFLEPRSLSELVNLLEKYGNNAKVMGGGTDLIPKIKKSLISPEVLINPSMINEINHVNRNKDGIIIGAGVRLGLLENNELLIKISPALHTAIKSVAARPIRNMATIGGNICLDTRCIYYEQSHSWKRDLPFCFKMGGNLCYIVPEGKKCHSTMAADTIPVLVASGAKVRVISSEGEKTISIEDLYTGNGVKPINLRANEFLKEIIIPFPDTLEKSAYLSFRLRKSIDFPVVSVAIVLKTDNGLCTDSRIVLGAVSPQPLRLRQLEESLKNQRITKNLLIETSKKASIEALKISQSGKINFFIRDIINTLVFRGLQSASNDSQSLKDN